jgi:cobalt-zinc-cadmium efflux system outer membrane protein
MKSFVAAASLAVAAPLAAQVGNPADSHVGTPATSAPVGPPAPVLVPARPPRSGPLPAQLSLPQALEEAAGRAPAVVAAERDVAAAEARLRQAGYRNNPELSVEVENFAGTGALKGLQATEITAAVNQRLDLGGRRSARVQIALAELRVQQLRLAIARADLARSVREQFARAVTTRERLEQAQDNVTWARELARVTALLVEAGRDPPLRAIRARSALAQASAALEAVQAEELAARSSLAALFGASAPVGGLTGSILDLTPAPIAAARSLEVQLADAERAAAAAGVRQQLAERRLDPAVGLGVRHVRETGDFGLVAGVSMPLRVFDRNQGGIAAARALQEAAEARRASILATTTAQARNAIAGVEAAERRVTALDKSAVSEAAEALRLTQRSYEEGRASLLELLDARNAYTAAQASLSDARLALALATAELGRISAQ